MVENEAYTAVLSCRYTSGLQMKYDYYLAANRMFQVPFILPIFLHEHSWIYSPFATIPVKIINSTIQHLQLHDLVPHDHLSQPRTEPLRPVWHGKAAVLWALSMHIAVDPRDVISVQDPVLKHQNSVGILRAYKHEEHFILHGLKHF